MSAATKRRIVEKEVAESLVELHADQIVARILAGRGNNLHEIELDGGDTCLASMPTKVRYLSPMHSLFFNRPCLVPSHRLGEARRLRGVYSDR